MSATSAPAETAAGKSEATTESTSKDSNFADVQSAIVRQVEFYFSDANLPTDKFLLKQVQSNPQGYVPIKLIAQFKRVKALSKGLDVVTEALQLSNELVVSEDGLNVKRLKPLPDVNENDIKRRTVIITQLPGVPSIESVTEQFSRYGPVKLVRICPPGSTEKLPQWLTGANPGVAAAASTNQLFALVEFATEDAANRAVNHNSPSKWREGVVVRRLVSAGGAASPSASTPPQQLQQQQQPKKHRDPQGDRYSRTPPNHGHDYATQHQQMQQGMSNLKLFAGDAGPPVPSPRGYYNSHTQYPGPPPQGSFRYHGGQNPLHSQPRNQSSSQGLNSFQPGPGQGQGQGHRGYVRDARGPLPFNSPRHPLLSTGGTMEAVLYTPPGGSDSNNMGSNSGHHNSSSSNNNNGGRAEGNNTGGGGSNRRSTSVQPAQKFLLVRPRLEGGGSGAAPANAAALRTTPAAFIGPQGGDGNTGGSPPGADKSVQGGERSVSVGRRAPHFVIDVDYRPPDAGDRGRHAGKVRARGRDGDNMTPPQHLMMDPQGRRNSLPGPGQGQGQGQGQNFNSNAMAANAHNEKKRGKSARGQNMNHDGMSSAPSAGAMLMQAQAAGGLQGLQGLVGGGSPLQLAGLAAGMQPPVGQEQAWQQLISAVQQLVQHQFGGVAPAAGAAAGQSPFAGHPAVGAASGEGAAPANTRVNSTANSSTTTPAKQQQQQQQQGKKGKQKGAAGKQHGEANGHAPSPTPGAGSKEGGEQGGMFVFHGDADGAEGQGASKGSTPVAKAHPHGKKGGKGTPGGQVQGQHGHGHGHGHTPTGSAKKGPQNGGDATAGGNGSGEEAAEEVKKKPRTKKDYANWAAATAGYRAQSAAMYGQGEGASNGGECGAAAAGGSSAPGAPQAGKDALAPAVRTPKVPDGTKGFGMGRGRGLPPPPPA